MKFFGSAQRPPHRGANARRAPGGSSSPSCGQLRGARAALPRRPPTPGLGSRRPPHAAQLGVCAPSCAPRVPPTLLPQGGSEEEASLHAPSAAPPPAPNPSRGRHTRPFPGTSNLLFPNRPRRPGISWGPRDPARSPLPAACETPHEGAEGGPRPQRDRGPFPAAPGAPRRAPRHTPPGGPGDLPTCDPIRSASCSTPTARAGLGRGRGRRGGPAEAPPPQAPSQWGGETGAALPAGGARRGSPDGTFVSASRPGGSAGRLTPGGARGPPAPRPAREPGGCPPGLHPWSERSREKSRSGPSPNHPGPPRPGPCRPQLQNPECPGRLRFRGEKSSRNAGQE